MGVSFHVVIRLLLLLGAAGSSQVALPSITESYSSAVDPPDVSVPVCTVKSFPYKAEHCIAWARSLVDELFVNDIVATRDAVDALTGLFTACDDELDSPLRVAERCAQIIVQNDDKELVTAVSKLLTMSLNPQEVVNWAISVFNRLFDTDLNMLVAQYPLDMQEEDEEGDKLFWSSSSRRFPVRIERFNISDPLHVAFVARTAQLRSQAYGADMSMEVIESHLRKSNSDDVVAAETSSSSLTEKLLQIFSARGISESDLVSTSIFVDVLRNYSKQLRPISFEKVCKQLVCLIYTCAVVISLLSPAARTCLT